MKETGSHKIAVAHNKNDNVETIMMHFIRGSGTIGLKGMEAKRENLIRPLIDCQRYEIEEYCEQKGLSPRIDKTNFDNIYTRNKIRNVVIPYLQQEFNPNIIETIDNQVLIELLEYTDACSSSLKLITKYRAYNFDEVVNIYKRDGLKILNYS